MESVLADDETAADRVGRAAVLAADDVDRAVGRLERDRLLLDLRTVDPGEEEELLAAVPAALARLAR